MTYTKQLTIDTDWLNSIDGLSVKKAIEYLMTLNPDHVLSYGFEDSTCGDVDVVSCLTYDVPMTNEEILAKLEERYTRMINSCEKVKKSYIDEGKTNRLSALDGKIAALQRKLDEVRARYK